jgi:hypothetical protein
MAALADAYVYAPPLAGADAKLRFRSIGVGNLHDECATGSPSSDQSVRVIDVALFAFAAVLGEVIVSTF